LLQQAILEDASIQHTPLFSLDAFDAQLPSPRKPASANADPLRAEVAILFTSGTSGRPKGCVLTNEYILGAAAWYRDMGGLLSWKTGADKLLNPLPVFHMNCSMVSFPTMCITQNCLVLPDRFHASQWWEDCVKSGATAIHYLGVMPPALFKQPVSDWELQHQIRFGLGAGCDPTLHGPFEVIIHGKVFSVGICRTRRPLKNLGAVGGFTPVTWSTKTARACFILWIEKKTWCAARGRTFPLRRSKRYWPYTPW
jgi:acyl-CoA synthetase (AMP-forming)/AMP-acid ligase II